MKKYLYLPHDQPFSGIRLAAAIQYLSLISKNSLLFLSRMLKTPYDTNQDEKAGSEAILLALNQDYLHDDQCDCEEEHLFIGA